MTKKKESREIIADALLRLSYLAEGDGVWITIPCHLAEMLDELKRTEGRGLEEFPLEETDYKLSTLLDVVQLTLRNHPGVSE